MVTHGWVTLSQKIDGGDVEWLLAELASEVTIGEYKIDTEMADPNREGTYIDCGTSRLYVDLDAKPAWESMSPGSRQMQLDKLATAMTKRFRKPKLGSRIMFDLVTPPGADLAKDQHLGWERILWAGQQALDFGWPAVAVFAIHDARGTKIFAHHPYKDDELSSRPARRKLLGSHVHGRSTARRWRYRLTGKAQSFDVKGDCLAHLGLALLNGGTGLEQQRNGQWR